MAICTGMNPYLGFTKPGSDPSATGTDSPSAAKLCLHFVISEAGAGPITKDGKMSGNSAVPPHPDERTGAVEFADRLTPHIAAHRHVRRGGFRQAPGRAGLLARTPLPVMARHAQPGGLPGRDQLQKGFS